MAIHEVFMPALSSTMTEGKIVSWQKSPGDKVEKGETVLIVESDKADMDVESFYEGYLATIIVPAGEAAPVGNTIALIAETQAEIEQAKQKASSQTATTTAPAPVAQAVAASSQATTATVAAAPPTTARNGRIVASPRARKLAKELNIDLARLTGSGPHGRIVAEDVQAASGGSTSTPTVQPSIPAPTVSKPVAPVSTPAPAAVPLGEVAAMNTLQNAVVRNMTASLSIPVFRVGYTITTDALDQLYKQLKSKGVTMTALLAKAVALALQKHPIVNASYVENGIQYHQGINIAIAVAMPDGGLITPVLKNADQIDIYSLSRTWQDLVERSRAKQLQPDEYSSGTFTLSNLGMFGVDRFDAILPQGQGSILAVGASRPQLVVSADGSMAVKRQMQVNITCDHRIIYGADAAAFLQSLAKLIETDVQSLTM
ncbi:dihydrolipoamide acetyltransferase family protein [Planktothrix mougeotii]|uniref:Dihydrolipoamide acetyltransferase component of pyruvate dehydrogenase complex n=1 Tax=Planktothrix mougeotii LEGE 06226 TaxID=1828728 RepID=A0ABR9UIR8_9CYAN|nr:dihydrolipoamide acetyltransferase family protein [Planktothrix mougeotii]MBE9145726.1 2-oxo acid dehydrogenase subunit E2 [Planktothrix mougeotii LEGE 06226]